MENPEEIGEAMEFSNRKQLQQLAMGNASLDAH
jgi:hypothetical protein